MKKRPSFYQKIDRPPKAMRLGIVYIKKEDF